MLYCDWVKTADSEANTEAALAADAATGHFHVLYKAEVAISGAAAGAAGITITVKSDATVLYKTFIPAAAAIGSSKVIDFVPPIRAASGAALSLNTSAGGADCVATLNITGRTFAG